MQQSSNLRVFYFAVIVTVVCAVILGLAATGLKDLHMINADIDMKSKVLQAIGIKIKDATTNEIFLKNQDILAFFEKDGYKGEKIKQIFFNSSGKEISVGNDEAKNLVPEKMAKQNLEKIGKYPIFLYYAKLANKKADAYIIPVFGKGLWSICYGFLALGKDAVTVKALIYYAHAETPGLGAEIVDNIEWVDQFKKGKKIIDNKGNLKPLKSNRDIDVRKNPEKYPYNFWHISGASFTVIGVDKMLDQFLTIYNPYLITKRGQ